MSPFSTAIAVFVLTTISVACFGVYFLRPQIFKKTRFRQRFDDLASSNFDLKAYHEIEEGRKWKRAVEKTLLEIDEKQKSFSKDTSKPNLVTRIRQAGLQWTKRDYIAINAVIGAVLFAASLLLGFSIIFASVLSLLGALSIPYIVVRHLRARRFRHFTIEFTNGVDMISRGLKSGLPINECIKIVASESAEPLKTEFRHLSQDLTLGLPMDISVHRFAERMPLHETNYFATVIGSQSKTGGSLSEVLANLSKILRDRRNMREKIRSLSAEAITSATIIGVIPFVVSTIVFFASPDYIGLLFKTRTGLITLLLANVWMALGIIVIYKMARFKF